MLQQRLLKRHNVKSKTTETKYDTNKLLEVNTLPHACVVPQAQPAAVAPFPPSFAVPFVAWPPLRAAVLRPQFRLFSVRAPLPLSLRPFPPHALSPLPALIDPLSPFAACRIRQQSIPVSNTTLLK